MIFLFGNRILIKVSYHVFQHDRVGYKFGGADLFIVKAPVAHQRFFISTYFIIINKRY